MEQYLAAVETTLARQVETRRARCHRAVDPTTAEHPFREGLWSLLMTALYRVGRQADALAAFQHARGLLVNHGCKRPCSLRWWHSPEVTGLRQHGPHVLHHGVVANEEFE